MSRLDPCVDFDFDTLTMRPLHIQLLNATSLLKLSKAYMSMAVDGRGLLDSRLIVIEFGEAWDGLSAG